MDSMGRTNGICDVTFIRKLYTLSCTPSASCVHSRPERHSLLTRLTAISPEKAVSRDIKMFVGRNEHTLKLRWTKTLPMSRTKGFSLDMLENDRRQEWS